MADCHKCKYETSAECVPRSQKLGYPNCYQSTVTNYDRIASKTPEELAVVLAWPYIASPPWCAEHKTCPYISEDPTPCDKCALEWLKQEAKE